MENFIALSELQAEIRSAIERNVRQGQWIVAEISELKVNYSGHCYLELVERPEKGKAPVAQARGIIWSSSYKMISGYFQFQTGSDLAAGMKILFKASVNYHPLYGLSLVISDIDPAYTLGETERLRRETIEQLQREGVYDMNREWELPSVIQRIAVISSARAAGYRDFMQELDASPYAFHTTLFPAVMQGEGAESSVVGALEQVAEREEEFDAAVIIRGGGSVSDLGCFDSYRLCYYIAQFPLPVLTGIGHDKDVAVADMVAHTSLKTPTAVAGFLVDRAREVDAALDTLSEEVTGYAQQLLMLESNRLENAVLTLSSRADRVLHGGVLSLDRLRHELHQSVGARLETGRRMLTAYLTELAYRSTRAADVRGTQLVRLRERLRDTALSGVERQQARLELLTVSVEAVSPQRILSRGYAIVRRGQGTVLKASEVSAGESLILEMQDGTVTTEVITKKLNRSWKKRRSATPKP